MLADSWQPIGTRTVDIDRDNSISCSADNLLCPGRPSQQSGADLTMLGENWSYYLQNWDETRDNWFILTSSKTPH